jgi:glycerol-3-phosphate acyltransferase PlsX
MGMRQLKKGLLDAFISAGNTGALIASATLHMPRIPTIKRPALLTTLPSHKGEVAVIDVGSHISCKAHHLVSFAQMGAAYQRCYKKIAVPTVGLLNIGVESKKGTSELRLAYQLLQEGMSASPTPNMQFVGNVEGREVFQGKVDVLVTDGFTGNILLKTSEGVSSFILEHLREALRNQPETREGLLKDFRYHFDYEEYAGAVICGVERLIIKLHGQTSAKGLLNAIRGAVDLIKTGFIQQIKSEFTKSN